MEHLLFAGYLILFAWLVTRTKFFVNSGLTPAQLVIVFLLKVMAGIFYGWIGVYYGQLAQMVDTWAFHYEALKQYELLKSDPVEFVRTLFHSHYKKGYGGFLSTTDSWWNDLKANTIIKIISVFNLLSFGNYYINVVFFSFLSLFGPVALYRIMKDVYPTRHYSVLLTTFLIPSFIYWTSGIHKDGLIFTGISLILYHMYFGFKEKHFSFIRILVIVLGLFLILMLRNFLLIPLIPALLAWILSQRSKRNPIVVYSGIYVLFLLLFFLSKFIHPQLDLPEAVVERQLAFLQLSGGSAIDVRRLEPNLGSFLINFPQALGLTTLRPYPSDVRHLLSLAAALEIVSILLLLGLFIVYRRPGGQTVPFILFCLFFSFSVLVMIGYSVNFLGAIVRYRSIILPFLLVPMIATIQWDKLISLTKRHIINN